MNSSGASSAASCPPTMACRLKRRPPSSSAAPSSPRTTLRWSPNSVTTSCSRVHGSGSEASWSSRRSTTLSRTERNPEVMTKTSWPPCSWRDSLALLDTSLPRTIWVSASATRPSRTRSPTQNVTRRNLREPPPFCSPTRASGGDLGGNLATTRPGRDSRQHLAEIPPSPRRRQSVSGPSCWTSVMELGDGPPLLLLHGGIACGGAMWAPVLRQLAGAHRVVVPDVHQPDQTQQRPVPALRPARRRRDAPA